MNNEKLNNTLDNYMKNPKQVKLQIQNAKIVIVTVKNANV